MPWRRVVLTIAVAITLFGSVQLVTRNDDKSVPAGALLVTSIGESGVGSVAIATDMVLISHGNMITAYSLKQKKVSWQRAGELRALAGAPDDTKLVLGDKDSFRILDLSRMSDPKYGSAVATLPGQAVWAYPSMVIAATCGKGPDCRLTRYDLTGQQRWSVKAPGAADASVLSFSDDVGPLTLPTDDVSFLVLEDNTGGTYDVFSTADGHVVRRVQPDGKNGEILDRDGEDLLYVRSEWNEGQCRYHLRAEAMGDTKALWQASDRDLATGDPHWGCAFGTSSVFGGAGLLRAHWGHGQELLLNVSDGKTIWSGKPNEHVLTADESEVVVSIEGKDAVAFDELDSMFRTWHKTPGRPQAAWILEQALVVEAADGTLININGTDQVIDPRFQVLAVTDQGAIVLEQRPNAVWFLPSR
jgi:hypothetical protein